MIDGPATGSSPTGPSDDRGWQNWTDVFANITADLCGSHGDAGFGRSSAMLLAQSRNPHSAGLPRRSPTAGLGRSSQCSCFGGGQVRHEFEHRFVPEADSFPNMQSPNTTKGTNSVSNAEEVTRAVREGRQGL